MKIGVDLDDVLLDCNTSLALFHNSRYGTSYERKDVQSWYLERTWGCTPREAIARVKEWYESREHAESYPVSGALATVAELSRRHELHVITSRPEQVRELTHSWLEKHFPGRFVDVHFTSHFEPGAGSKAAVCRNLGISLFIEDSPLHARDVATSGVTVLLLDCPWNQETVSGNIIRIFAWDDVLTFVASGQAPVS
ncbi:MAG: hypothetical protein KGH56_03835 [Patescibacteria group bacterium]|nr:hypothetical protein [Patescibacteria group bacterium]